MLDPEPELQQWTGGESEESVAHKQLSIQARESTLVFKPGQTSPEVQNKGLSGSI